MKPCADGSINMPFMEGNKADSFPLPENVMRGELRSLNAELEANKNL